MNNQIRRQLLERHRASGFPGSIMDVFSAYNQGIDLITDFQQQQQQQVRQQQLQQLQQAQQAQQQEQQVVVAETPEEQAEGLRPYHEAGNTNQTMVFPNIPANTPFNTVGMKAPINIEKYNNQGHLVESFKNVPPGIQSLPTGSQEGIVIETPANMQTGGQRSPIYTDNPKDSRLQAYNDSLSLYNSHTPTNRLAAQLEEIKTNPNFRYYRSLTNSELNSFPGKIKPIGGTHFDIPKLISDSISGKNTTYSYYRVFDESGKEIPNEIGVSLSYKEPVQPVIYRELSRLTPKEATQIQVNTNKSLQESNREEVRTRPSQTIFRQDPSVSKGQYPVGERIWDTSTRSWKTDMWDAEMQKDSRELAVPRQERWRTIDVPEGGFQTGGRRKYQDGGFNVTTAVPEWRATGPGMIVDGKLYQDTQRTGNTLIQVDPETGEQIPILLPTAEVYSQEDSITGAMRKTGAGLFGSAINKNQYDEIGDKIRSERDEFALKALSATGDIISKPQQYLINAPLALAMGKTPNLSMFPSTDRLNGIDNGPAYPSETLGITNPYGAFAINALTDPIVLAGMGLARQPIQQGLKRTGNYLTQNTPLKNAWKLNPKAYQYNLPENTMWRGLGKEGMEDAVQSGVFRSKQNIIPEYFPGTKLRMNKSFGNNPYFSPNFNTASTYGDNFIAEVPRSSANWTKRYVRANWSQIADKEIPITEGRILQKDWWKGYSPFKSNLSKGF